MLLLIKYTCEYFIKLGYYNEFLSFFVSDDSPSNNNKSSNTKK